MQGKQVDPLEREIETQFYEYCKARNILCIKLNLRGRVGWPDRLLIWKGHVEFVELKRRGEEPDLIQALIHGLLAKHLMRVHVCDNLEDAKRVVDDILRKPPRV